MLDNIKTIHRKYFQKSKVFLYPALNIVRGSSITPIQTYMAWEEFGIAPRDSKLLCLYHHRTDKEYSDFEAKMLKGNKLYESSIKVDDGSKAVYIFDLKYMGSDFFHVRHGRYSKISIPHKKIVKDFFRKSLDNFAYIESYLHPEKYYSIYSDLLSVPIETLKEVVELCSAPDIPKETLVMSTSLTENKQSNTNQQ